MGVSGCGKTTVGKLLSEKTKLPFYDADDFHTDHNIQKMKNHQALSDDDRTPWLEALSNHIAAWENQGGAILACSALKEKYRDILSSKNTKINWVYLDGSFELIKSRLEKRHGHYMKATLLESQFATLEIPNYGCHTSVEKPLEEIVSDIITKFNLNE